MTPTSFTTGQDVDVSALRQRVEQLDRDWTANLDQYRLRDRKGNISLPSRVATLFVGIFGSFFAILWIGFAISLHSVISLLLVIPGFLGLLGFVVQCKMRLNQ